MEKFSRFLALVAYYLIGIHLPSVGCGVAARRFFCKRIFLHIENN